MEILKYLMSFKPFKGCSKIILILHCSYSEFQVEYKIFSIDDRNFKLFSNKTAMNF
jgi:hypothetical protein